MDLEVSGSFVQEVFFAVEEGKLVEVNGKGTIKENLSQGWNSAEGNGSINYSMQVQ
ncbi:MAG: hypothetical protein ABIH42_09665 [Planctomycetota bacterium]